MLARHAAFLKYSIWPSQLVIGFQLVKIWATNLNNIPSNDKVDRLVGAPKLTHYTLSV